MALVIDIADALVADLNAAAFDRPFKAVRGYVPTYDLQDMRNLHVTVVPKAVPTDEALDRERWRWEVEIDVGVQQKVNPAKPAEVDPLVDLVQAMKDHLRDRDLALPDGSVAEWGGTEWPTLWLPDHMREYRQFTSVLTLTYEVVR